MTDQGFVVTDRLRHRVAPLLPGQATDRGVAAPDNHLFLEAVLRRVRTGAPWRHLPTDFRNRASQLGRCRRWPASSVVQRVFAVLSGDPDPEDVRIDGTIVPVHQKAAGQRRPGHSGWLLLLPGQSHESKGVAPLIRSLPFAALLADKALDSDGVLGELQVHGAPAGIPPAKANRQERRGYDKEAPTGGAI